MATFVLEDLGAAVEVMVFPRTMADHGHVLEDDAIVCVQGPPRPARRRRRRSSRWRSPARSCVLDGGPAGAGRAEVVRSSSDARVRGSRRS